MVVFHKHLIIRAEVANPPQQEDVANIWMAALIDKIGYTEPRKTESS